MAKVAGIFASRLLKRAAALLPVVVVVAGGSSVPAVVGTGSSTSGAGAFQTRKGSGLRTSLGSSTRWEDLEEKLGESWKATGKLPVTIDSVLDPSPPKFSEDRPTLFRERHGWCPYSERVWLAFELECGGNDDSNAATNLIDYDTIRIDNTGHGPRPSYFASGQTPQVRWPEATRLQGESMDLVEEIDRRYRDGSLRSSDPAEQDAISQFRNIFPRARPSSRAAFLFQYSGEPLWKSTFEKTLLGVDELLAKGKSSNSDGGPFFCGNSEVTAADIAWAPFLERYRYQLPCLHSGLRPDDATKYPNLAAWYDAMDTQVAAYACRVKGDASSWRKVLTMAGFGNSGVPPDIEGNMDELADAEAMAVESIMNLELWRQYASSRPYVADTPHAEAALTIARNRSPICNDVVKRASSYKGRWPDLPETEQDVDRALRGLVSSLLGSEAEGESEAGAIGAMASFLDHRMCVPRDMGAMPAACIKAAARKLKMAVSW